MALPLMALLLGATPLKVGDKAPDFTLPDTDGKPVTLSALLQNGPVILAFYPKAFTPGCTKQNQNFRDKLPSVQEKGAQVIGISVDSVAKQKEFKEKYGLPYPLLSDGDGKVAALYPGKMPVLGVANRANFVIDQQGIVTGIVEGSDAIDPTSAIAQCPLRKKAGT
ncbi:MAG TPA: peroxiredoxin [Anaeromyxobacter sp.]|nr:peroxiredoxin [Anaeromyxobacter sp.]